MNTINISGSIGYIFMKNETDKILILADMHSTLPYCDKNGIFISNWLGKKTNSQILLEEVPRTNTKLKELWTTSPHTQKLKNLYLNSTLIDGVDIRPFLIPFSWELIFEKNLSIEKKSYLSKIIFKSYLELLNCFFTLKLEYFKKNLGYIYTKDFLKDSILGKHFLMLKNTTKEFIQTNKKYLSSTLKEVLEKASYILERINDLISFIMEWFIMARIIKSKKDGKHKFIIHAGLAHTANIHLILGKIYDFKIIDKYGINDMENSDEYTNGCLKLPKEIDDQFGGYNVGIF
jgi:hypothetical protein